MIGDETSAVFDEGEQPDLWNDQYLNDPDWIYGNGYTYYYNGLTKYVLCEDQNGTTFWELPGDCDNFNGSSTITQPEVIEEPTELIIDDLDDVVESSTPQLEWW